MADTFQRSAQFDANRLAFGCAMQSSLLASEFAAGVHHLISHELVHRLLFCGSRRAIYLIVDATAYATPNMHVEYVRVPTAFWPSVGPSHNVFVIESFIDELA